MDTSTGWLFSHAPVIQDGANHQPVDLFARALNSDRGSQYLSSDYRNLIEDHEMVQSVGRTGVSADNAVAEAAWSSLKRELVSRYRFATRAQARRAIFAWINRYNTRRRHSSLGYITPTEWETRYDQPRADQAA